MDINSELSDFNDEDYNSEEINDAETIPTDCFMSGAEVEVESYALVSFSASREGIDSEDETTLVDDDMSDDEDDEDADDEGNSEDEVVPDYTNINQQRQSALDDQVFYFKTYHHCVLTEAGIQLLKSTEKGRAALQEQQAEGEKVQSRSRDVPLPYKSPDVLQLLLDSPEASLCPIIAKDDEVRLKFNMTALFPAKARNKKLSAKQFHRSGLNGAIDRMFHENREGLCARHVTVLPADSDKDYFQVLLSMEPRPQYSSHSTKPALAVLEHITIKLRSTSKGQSRLDLKEQKSRRMKTYKAICCRTLPIQLLSTLERCLSRFTQLDLVQKYGALFNSAYTTRANEVEGHVSRIARIMAEIYIRYDKLESAIEAAKEEDILEEAEDQANGSGRHRAILETSQQDIDEIKVKAAEIKTEFLALDRGKVPYSLFKPGLVTSSGAEKRKPASGGTDLSTDGADLPGLSTAPSSQSNRSRRQSQSHRLSQSSTLVSSSQSSTLVSSPQPNRRRSQTLSSQASSLEDDDPPSFRQSLRLRGGIAEDVQVPRPSRRPPRRAVEEVPPKTYVESDSDYDEDIGVRQEDVANQEPNTSEEKLIILKQHLDKVSEALSRDRFFPLIGIMVEPQDGIQECGDASAIDETVKSWHLLVNVFKGSRRDTDIEKEYCFEVMKDIINEWAHKRGKGSAGENAPAMFAQSEDSMQVDEQMTSTEDVEEGREAEANSSMRAIRTRPCQTSSAEACDIGSNNDDDDEQSRARKRMRQSGDGQDEGRRRRENVQVNGGSVGWEDDCSGLEIADDQNRPATHMASKADGWSQGVREPSSSESRLARDGHRSELLNEEEQIRMQNNSSPGQEEHDTRSSRYDSESTDGEWQYSESQTEGLQGEERLDDEGFIIWKSLRKRNTREKESTNTISSSIQDQDYRLFSRIQSSPEPSLSPSPEPRSDSNPSATPQPDPNRDYSLVRENFSQNNHQISYVGGSKDDPWVVFSDDD